MVAKTKLQSRKKKVASSSPAKKKEAPKRKTPSKNPKEKRDYRKEYDRDQSSDERKKYRAELGRKNRASEKAGKTSKGDGKDMAHSNDVRKGGEHSGETKPQDAKKNRAWRKGKTGYDRK